MKFKQKVNWLQRCGIVTSTVFLACAGSANTRTQVSSNSTPLSIDEAVTIGIHHNPQIQAADAGVAAAMATYQSLGVLPNFMFGLSQVQGSSTAPSLTGDTRDTIISLSTTVDLSGQRRYQAAGSHANYLANRFQFQETILTLEQQIRDAYWTLAASQASTKLSEKSVSDAQKIYDLTVIQEKVGTSPKGDVIRSSIDLANAKQALLTAKNSEASALISLNTLLARPPKLAIELASKIEGGNVSIGSDVDKLPTLEELTRQGITNRPLLKSSTEQVQSARFAVRQAESSRLPDLDISYQRSTVQQVDALTLTLSFPLFDFGSIHHNVKAAESTKKQAESQRALAGQQITQQVAQAHSDLETAILAAKSYKAEILDPSVTLFDMANLGYQNGATGILPVIDAESTLRNARIGFINTLLSVEKAKDELKAATGISEFLRPHPKG